MNNNKIIITDNNIDINIDESITFNDLSENDSLINKISLDILNDSLLEIEYNIEENKGDTSIFIVLFKSAWMMEACVVISCCI